MLKGIKLFSRAKKGNAVLKSAKKLLDFPPCKNCHLRHNSETKTSISPEFRNHLITSHFRRVFYFTVSPEFVERGERANRREERPLVAVTAWEFVTCSTCDRKCILGWICEPRNKTQPPHFVAQLHRDEMKIFCICTIPNTFC